MRLSVWVMVWSAAAVLVLAGCDRAENRRVREPAAGVRIVALSPALTRIARDLGAADRLVGRHAFDAWADPALPVCGDQSGLDYEALLAARPTHVLTQWGQRDLPARLAELARERGWVVEDFRLLTLEDLFTAGEGVQRVLDPAVAFRDTAAGRRLAASLERRAGVDAERLGPVLLLYGGVPPAALGPGSWHAQVLERLGARAAVSSGGAYQTLDAEDLAALRPGAIIVIAPRGDRGDGGAPASSPAPITSRAAAVQLLGRLGGLDVPALRPLEQGRAARVAVIDDPMAAVPGTNLADVAEAMARVLEAWSRE